jgi:hypothetical protein
VRLRLAAFLARSYLGRGHAMTLAHDITKAPAKFLCSADDAAASTAVSQCSPDRLGVCVELRAART